MAPVITVLRVLGLDDTKWTRVGPASLSSALALAVAASVVMALNRFGGQLIDAPRSFVRLTLVGVWGWVGLAFAVWLIATPMPVSADQAGDPPSSGSFRHTLAAVGFAHTPLLVLGLVIFVAAGLLQTLGPGLVVAVFVVGFWFPAVLTIATRHTHDLNPVRAASVVAVPYLMWLLVIGRHLLGQVQHLL